MESTKLSDEEILRGLNANPQIKNRIASLLAVVEDSGGDLRLADAAEARLIEEIRQMGQEAMQAWAERQAGKCEQEVRQSGGVHREGKKNSAGTPPLATSALTSRNTATAADGFERLRKAPKSASAAVHERFSGRSPTLARIKPLPR